MHRNNIHIMLALLLLFNVSGCRSKQIPVAAQTNTMQPVWTSQRETLRSTVLMIEASKQKMLGNWAQATVLYHDAVTADPGNDAAHFELAKIHAMQGAFEDALTYAGKAVELSPENHYYMSALADIYILSNNLGKAIDTYKMLVAAQPKNLEYAYNLATAYMYNNQEDAALEMLIYIENQIGFSEEISIEKQKIWVEAGMYDMAIEEAKKLVANFPDELIYYELLGDLYRETGQLSEAGKLYEEMLRKDPENILAHLLMADYYLEAGNKDEAFDILLKIFTAPQLTKEARARVIYRYYLLSEGDEQYLEQGFELCRLMIDMHPKDPESYLVYGDYLNRALRLEEARDAYWMASQLNPANLSVWQQILSLDGRLRDFESMRLHAEKALEYYFEQPILFLFNGLANLQLKNYHDAASSLEYGLAMAEADQDLRLDFLSMLGDTYHYLDNHQKSDTYYEQVLEKDPQNATVLNNYSYHLSVRKERLDDAERMSKKAKDLDANNAAFLDTYGWIMYQRGNYTEAKKWIEKALQLSEYPSSDVLEHYGDVMYKLGNKQEAIRYWEKAREAGDGSEFLQRKIKDKTLYE